MVPDPLAGPLDCLAPPVRVRVEDAEVDVGQGQLDIEVATVVPVVEPISIGRVVKATLTTPGNEVVAVDALDLSAHLVGPGREQVWCAVRAPGKVASAIGTAAGLVGELPCKNRR